MSPSIVLPSLGGRHSKGKQIRMLGAGEARSNPPPLPFTKCVQVNWSLCGSYSIKSFKHILIRFGLKPPKICYEILFKVGYNKVRFPTQGSSVICSNTLKSTTLKFAIDNLTKIICYTLTAFIQRFKVVYCKTAQQTTYYGRRNKQYSR